MPTAHWVALGCAGSASQFVVKWRHLLRAVCNTATITSWRSHRVGTPTWQKEGCNVGMSVGPSARNNSATTQRGCEKKKYVRGFWLKSVGTIQACLKSDKNYKRHVKAYARSWWDIIIGADCSLWGAGWGWRKSWASSNIHFKRREPTFKKSRL